MIFGHPATDDRFCPEIARVLGIVVASVRYRLAPAHPYPSAIDDHHDAWMWLLRNANTFDIDPARIDIGGQSAGGGLATAQVQRACDGSTPYSVKKWLICPMLDEGTAARRVLEAERHFVWENHLNLSGWRPHLGSDPGGSATAPFAVPRSGTT